MALFRGVVIAPIILMVGQPDKPEDIETLARMAARLAGRDPDEFVQLKLADIIAFDDVMWRYPDFLARAEAAYAVLTKVCLERPISLNGHERLSTDRADLNQTAPEERSPDTYDRPETCP